jgi:type IV secretory pathway VirB9-like protein
VNKFLKNFMRLLFLTQGVVSLWAADGARLVKYSETDVIPIHAKVRFSTLIILPPEEEILDFTTGDKDFWILNGAHNLCYLHPAQAGIRSNLNLVTESGHVYSFLLIEISKETDTEPDLKVFVVPSEESRLDGTLAPTRFIRASEAEAYKTELSELRRQLAEQMAQAQAKADTEVAQYRKSYPAKLQFDYSFPRKATQLPFLISQIYHDDRFTFVKSSAREKPAIYELKDSKPSLINFDYENGLYLIPKIIDAGYIVVGRKKVTFIRRIQGR